MIHFRALEGSSAKPVNSALSPFTFPAGEAHTKREERRPLGHTEIAIITPSSDSIHDDLFQLAMWKDTIDRHNESVHYEEKVRTALLIPYFPGARADRGTPFGLAVYANFVNKLRIDHVSVFDPHSPELTRQLGTDAVLYPQDIIPADYSYMYDGVIAPDKGAVKRAKAVADKLGLPLFTAEKERDFETGKLKGYKLNALSVHGRVEVIRKGNRLLVVDDICDGGGTFMLLAKAVEDTHLDVTLDLYVSHPVFSGQAPSNLLTAYDTVYTTGSILDGRGKVQGYDHPRVQHLPLIRHMVDLLPVKVDA